MAQSPRRILVIRNDKLGDFMLAFPAFLSLKQNLPDTEIHALIPHYTRDMAQACAGIDHIVTDPGPGAGLIAQLRLWRALRRLRYDAVITLYSTSRVGLLCRLARIPWRLAPATKVAQLFYNHRLTQRRSRSEKPEAEYNLDLARHYLHHLGINAPATPNPPYLGFAADEIQRVRSDFCQQHRIDTGELLIFVHPGSGGSASNLSIEQFAQLAGRLRSGQGHTIVISAGPGEAEAARRLSAQLSRDTPHAVYISTEGLLRFAHHIAMADLFISGSTGPLHIAGALDRPTAGFYTRRRSALPQRWRTLNSEGRRLAFTPPEDAAEEDMSSIDMDACAKEISDTFLC